MIDSFDTHMGRSNMADLKLSGLTAKELELIHQATLSLLEKTGVRVESSEAVEILEGAGARVDGDDHGFRVKLPPHLVEDCISRAPGKITLFGRDPRYDITLEKGRSCFTLFGENVNVIDPHTLEHRSCTKRDLGQATRVADALNEIGIVE